MACNLELPVRNLRSGGSVTFSERLALRDTEVCTVRYDDTGEVIGHIRLPRLDRMLAEDEPAPVIDLDRHRCRDLHPRCREVIRRIREGANCKLCGDMGALVEATNEPTPCMSCGKRGEPWPDDRGAA